MLLGTVTENRLTPSKFELRTQGAETMLIFDHVGFPEEHRAHLETGWHTNYWEPLQKHLI